MVPAGGRGDEEAAERRRATSAAVALLQPLILRCFLLACSTIAARWGMPTTSGCRRFDLSPMTSFGPGNDRAKPRPGAAPRKAPTGAHRPSASSRPSYRCLSNSCLSSPPAGPAGGKAGGQKGQTAHSQQGQAGRGRVRAAVPPLPHGGAGGGTLQRLAMRVQQQHEDDVQQAAAPPSRVLPRHMQSAVGQLLGGASSEEPAWPAEQQCPADSGGSPNPMQQQHQEERWQRQPSPPPPAEAPIDFSRRNMARLGGEAMAGIFGAPSSGGPAC